ncbi:MAG: hypothetical protein ACHQ1D_13415 [Nitrososphaerales archaeon]
MSSKDKIKTNSLLLKKAMKCESLDEGTFAFLNWMNCKSFDSEGYEQNPPLVLKYVDFPKIGLVRLFDRFLGQDVLVNMVDCVPSCGTCLADDCSHVGFTICLLQLIEREGFELMDDILK